MSDQYLVQELAIEFCEESKKGNMCQAIRELMEDARNEGIERGIRAFVELAEQLGLKKEDITEEICRKFDLTKEKAYTYVENID